MNLLQDRVVVVTGAGSGIGEACAIVAADMGARVVLMDRAIDQARDAAALLPGACAVEVDVADPDSVGRAVTEVLANSGRIDGLVHAAGIDDPVTKGQVAEQVARNENVDTLTDLSNEQWRRMMAVNLDGSFYMMRAVLHAMRSRRSGAIVMIGSETGARGLAGLVHYAASKGGVHALVRSAAKEAAGYGVRVNGIAPGVIDTPMSRRSHGLFGGASAIAPLGRAGNPEEIGGVAAFLLSDLASYVVGEIVNVDGGRVAS
jgi:3-oxoacyl-[acyl-carrier protein] reductase